MKKIYRSRRKRRDFSLMPRQLVLVMRLMVAFLTMASLGVSAKGFSQTITWSGRNVSLEEIFSVIEGQTGYVFFYNDADITKAGTVSISLKDATLQNALSEVLRNEGLTYDIVNKTIFVHSTYRGSILPAAVLPKEALDRNIHGLVIDSATRRPLIGVTVQVKGSSVGAATDEKGTFSLSAPDNAVLVFSYVGYKSREVTVKGRSEVNVMMQPDVSSLNQLVVIGYGTQKQGALTGSISTLDYGQEMKSRPVTGTMEALQGMIPGVTITRQSGQPGNEGYNLRIRGTSSINGNVPLVLIDGIPGDINSINPNDIKSITVLRDAAAAIYGARAADGVILVTTRQGKKSDHPKVSYSYNLALKDVSYIKKPSTTEHFVKMFNEANLNDGDPQTFSDETLAKVAARDTGTGPGENWGVQSYPMFYQSHAWYQDLFKPSMRQTHNVSISGGTDYSTYLISGGYMNDDGNIAAGSNSFERYDLRVNLQTQLTKGLDLDANLSYDDQDVKGPSELGDAIDNALKAFAYIPFRNPAGNYYTYQGYQNPFQELKEGGVQSTKNSKFNSNFKLDWKPIPGLDWTGQAAINIENYNDNANYPTFYGYNWDNTPNSLPRNSPNSAYFNQWSSQYRSFSTYANYTKSLGAHEINVMAGASSEKFGRKTENMSGSDFTSNEIFTLPLSDPNNLSAGDYWDDNSWALLSYFGRISYSFNNKYFLDATMRKDGSSKFSPTERWSGIYPSISAAWKVSEEPFFKKIVSSDLVDLFKFRASWGRTGNQDISALGLFDYIQLISIGGEYPIDGSSISKMASLNGIAAPDRTWETIETKNLGFDLGLLHSKLTFSFDIYQKENTDMLVSVVYPATLGAAAPSSNAGSLRNRGWELTGRWNSKIGAVQFHAGLIVSYNTNKLINLQGQNTYNVGLTGARQGYPLNSYFGYKGSIIKTQAQLDAYAAQFAGKGIVPATQPDGHKGLGIGDLMYQDIDADGQITAFGDKSKGYDGDAVYLGSQDPKVVYSVNAGLNYRNFDFSILLQGTGNKYVWRGNGNFGVPFSVSWFPPLDYFYGKTFSQSNPGAEYPRLSNSATVNSNNHQFSDIWLVNTKYLKVENLTLGYTFKSLMLKKLNLEGSRVYFSGENLFEFAKGTWDNDYDPEENSAENNYPLYRTFSFGVNVNF